MTPIAHAAVQPLRRKSPFHPLDNRDPLLPDGQMLGIKRSTSFPLAQWRADDRFRTVYFDEGEGRTLLFVHGLGANATHWEFVAPELARDHRVLGIDVVGCGWSAKPDIDYSLELVRDHILSFLDWVGVERVTLVGHSMGGAASIAAALAQPDRVDGLVTLCAPCYAPFPRWMQLGAPLVLRRRLLYHLFVESHDWIIKGVFVDAPEQNPGVRWFRESSLDDEPGYSNLRDFARVAESLCLNVVKTSYYDRLPELQIPVMSLWGETDALTAVPAVLRAMDRVQRVRTVVIPRTGHMPMIERPQETLFHLKRFLQNPP